MDHPYLVAPSRPICEVSRQGERDWVTASRENCLIGPCQPLVLSPEDVRTQKQELSCPVPRRRGIRRGQGTVDTGGGGAARRGREGVRPEAGTSRMGRESVGVRPQRLRI